MRVARQAELDAGRLPDFLPQTAAIRSDVAWRCAPPAPGLVDRRVEITVDPNPKLDMRQQRFNLHVLGQYIWQLSSMCLVHVSMWRTRCRVLHDKGKPMELKSPANCSFLKRCLCLGCPQGPVDRKMVINALNSGATQFMADFEGDHGRAMLERWSQAESG
jgi:malate synthase